MDYKLKYIKYKEKYKQLKYGGYGIRSINTDLRTYEEVDIIIIHKNCIIFLKNNKERINLIGGKTLDNHYALEGAIYNLLYEKLKKSIAINIELIKDMTINKNYIDYLLKPSIWKRCYICSIPDSIELSKIFDKNNLYFKSLEIDEIEDIEEKQKLKKIKEENSLIYIPIEHIRTKIRFDALREKGSDLRIYDNNMKEFILYDNIFEILKKFNSNNFESFKLEVFKDYKHKDIDVNTIIFHYPTMEDPRIWWNQNYKKINLGDNNVSCKRTIINIILQSTDYFRNIALKMNIKLFEIIKLLQSEITKNGCEINDEYLVDKIQSSIVRGDPGAFIFDIKYLQNTDNLNELNFRELMYLYSRFIDCSSFRRTVKEYPLLLDLVFKLKYLLKLKKETIEVIENKELYTFFLRLLKINTLMENNFEFNDEALCANYNKCNNSFFSGSHGIPKIEQNRLTVTYKNMEDFGIPLSSREKSIINRPRDTVIGWTSGITSSYISYGKMIVLADKYHYDLATGVSGNMIRNLLFYHILDLDINKCIFASIAFLNGCFHHSVFECVLAALHLKRKLIEKYGSNYTKYFNLEIDHAYLDYENIIKEKILSRIKKEKSEKIKKILETDECLIP